MGGIAEEDIDRVKASTDIVELIGRFVPLKKAGRNFVGMCPFHAETSPSFNVNPERQIFKCFGCGKAGNVFSFLMEYNKMEFPQAVRALAEECGVEIEQSRGEDRARADQRKAVYAAAEFAQSFFRRSLLSSQGGEARKYLLSRGISEETSESFGLGFSPDDWSALVDAAAARGIGPDTLEKAGLAIPRQKGDGHYDRFRGRVVFPIQDAQGKVLGFGGRIIAGDGPKYINSPETPIYRKGTVLYGLNVARHNNPEESGLIIMEGYTDVIAAHQAGFRNAVASLGTALTSEQASLARRFTRRISLMYDSDPPGRTAMERAVEVLAAADLDARVAVIPGSKDPADFLAVNPPKAFADLLSSAPDTFEFRLAEIKARLDLTTIGGRAQAVDDLIGLATASRNPVQRQLTIKRIADAVGTTEAAVAQRASAERSPGPARAAEAPAPDKCSTSRIEADIIEALICDNRLIDSASGEFPAENFRDRELREAAETIYSLRGQGRMVGISDVLRSTPRGILSEIVDRIACSDGARQRDFESQYRNSLSRLDRYFRQQRIEEVKRDLRRAESAGDNVLKDELLRRLQGLVCPGQPPGKNIGKD